MVAIRRETDGFFFCGTLKFSVKIKKKLSSPKRTIPKDVREMR